MEATADRTEGIWGNKNVGEKLIKISPAPTGNSSGRGGQRFFF